MPQNALPPQANETPAEQQAPQEPTITVTEPPKPAAPTTGPADPKDLIKDPTVQSLIEKVRAEEKDKLYGNIEELKQQVSEITKREQEKIAAAQEEARRQAEEEARKRFEEADAKTLLQDVEQSWEQRFAQLQQEREQERALFEKEREMASLADFTRNTVQQAVDAGDVAPELAQWVRGNNEQEILASLEDVKATTQNLRASMQSAVQQMQAAKPGVSATGYTPTGPLEVAEGTRNLSAEDIRNMSMTDYAKYRPQFLGSGAAQPTGMFR